ncbi:MAG: protein kinase [Lentisphaeraceae bacterium]|nr:protein kinase [Lentisphaeraceae bacterium]
MDQKSNINETEQNFITSFYDEAMEIAPSNLYKEITEISRRYIGERQFALGGMKAITVCQDEATGRLLAKAVMKESSSEAEVESFLREARITASLQHPNIIPVYDIGVDQFGRPFFTMKLIEGETLETILFKKKNSEKDVPLESLIEVFIKVNEAIAYAHSKGVVHLDIKPANIQISDYGEVLILDWGLAKIIDEDWVDERFEAYSLSELHKDNKTIDGYVKGTLGYLSPEQAVPGRHRDHRSDIYALGALLYEMLTLRKPIMGESLKLVLKKTIEGRIKKPSHLVKSVPRSLEAICMKALETDPADRYQSVNDIIEDLQAYTRGFATDAEQAGSFEQLSLFCRRNTAVMLLSLFFITCSFVLLIFFFFSLKEKQLLAEVERDKAVETLKLLKEEKEKTFFYVEKFKSALGQDAFKAYKIGDFKQALALIKYQSDEDSKILKSKIHLLKGQYDKAELALEGLDSKKVKMLKELKLLFERPVELTFEAILALFTEFKDDPILHRVLDQQLPVFRYDKRYKCIREMMKEKDGLHPKYNFLVKKTSGGFSVDLHGNRKVSSLQYLKYLGPIVELDLSSTNVSSISELKTLPLKSLSLNGTNVSDLNPLLSIKSLRTLKVDSSFPTKKLSGLPKSIKVIKVK